MNRIQLISNKWTAQFLPRRSISTTNLLKKISVGKQKTTRDRSNALTYEMSIRPYLIGVRKAWLTWHTQDLEDFRQTQPYQVAQDEMIRRFMKAFFPEQFAFDELVIKRRGNLVFVAGFVQGGHFIVQRRIYWTIGFAEEFLSLLLKQPVKLELQMYINKDDIVYKYI